MKQMFSGRKLKIRNVKFLRQVFTTIKCEMVKSSIVHIKQKHNRNFFVRKKKKRFPMKIIMKDDGPPFFQEGISAASFWQNARTDHMEETPLTMLPQQMWIVPY